MTVNQAYDGRTVFADNSNPLFGSQHAIIDLDWERYFPDINSLESAIQNDHNAIFNNLDKFHRMYKHVKGLKKSVDGFKSFPVSERRSLQQTSSRLESMLDNTIKGLESDLDKANTETYGTPEPTQVNIGVGKKPGILISGHDLKDMKMLTTSV